MLGASAYILICESHLREAYGSLASIYRRLQEEYDRAKT